MLRNIQVTGQCYFSECFPIVYFEISVTQSAVSYEFVIQTIMHDIFFNLPLTVEWDKMLIKKTVQKC